MVLKLRWRQKRIETFFWGSKAKSSKLFVLKFGHRKFLEICFEVTLRLNMNGLNVWKWHFPVFCKFLSDKVKPFFGKARQNVKYCLNQNLLIGSLIKNGFKATLRSKTNVNLKAVLQGKNLHDTFVWLFSFKISSYKSEEIELILSFKSLIIQILLQKVVTILQFTRLD